MLISWISPLLLWKYTLRSLKLEEDSSLGELFRSSEKGSNSNSLGDSKLKLFGLSNDNSFILVPKYLCSDIDFEKKMKAQSLI